MQLTYRNLKEAIEQMDADQLNLDVTIASGPVDSSQTEFYPIFSIEQTGEEVDVLDLNHIVLVGDF